MSKCKLEDCHNGCFEEEDKCILHCKKDDWYEIKDNEKDWSKSSDKINAFWNNLQKPLESKYKMYIYDNDSVYRNYELTNVIFPKFQYEKKYNSYADNIEEYGRNFYSHGKFAHEDYQEAPGVNTFFSKCKIVIKECSFLDVANFKKYNLEDDILFDTCIFSDELLLNNFYKKRVSFLNCTVNNLDCSEITFEQKVKIQNSTISKEANFNNTKFKNLADFYRTKFNEVNFERTDFDDIAVFTEAIFHKSVNFKNTKFLGYSLFIDTVIEGKLNLRNTIFGTESEANFLDITSEVGNKKNIQVENRETARLIKSFFEYSNNIIEANKFYALEMKMREKELNDDVKSFNNISEWLIFIFHGISSNHSQSAPLALFWITIVSFIYTYFAINEDVGIVPFYDIFNNDFLNAATSNINPFSIMTSKEPITFGLLLFKITIAYLIYQFIVSVRQNTRRK